MQVERYTRYIDGIPKHQRETDVKISIQFVFRCARKIFDQLDALNKLEKGIFKPLVCWASSITIDRVLIS